MVKGLGLRDKAYGLSVKDVEGRIKGLGFRVYG
jgi:hypothetical protein